MNMAEVEANSVRRAIHGESGPNCGVSANEIGPLTTAGTANRRSRQKVLLIGDKRPVIYPRYWTSKTGRQPQAHGGICHGSPSDETAVDNSTALVDSSNPPASRESLKDISQGDDEMCQAYDDDVSEMTHVQTEWKLVETLLAT